MTNLCALVAKRHRKLAWLSVLGLMISAPPQQLAAAATPEQICSRSSFFGTDGCNNTSEAAKIFWVPPCEGNNPVAGRARRSDNRSEYIVSILYNRSPSTRRLQLNGTMNRDIIIGSPGSSDIINGGGGGDNAYMVGGGTSILSADGSSVTPGGSTERDVLNLSAGAIDFINIKPAGQSLPISILVPMRDAADQLVFDSSRRLRGMSRPVRGSGEITSATAPENVRTMTTACPPAPRSMGPAALSVAMAPGLGQPMLPLGMGASPFPVILAQPFEPPAPEEPITPSFPGVPVLQGFALNGSDVLVLSVDDFPIDINEYPNLSQSRWPTPLQMGGHQATLPSSNLAPRRLNKIYQCDDPCRPKQNTSRQETPLIYNNKNGLLVFSQNKAPLGSKSNPGLVIAQLLDQSGLPLKLKQSGGTVSFPARFLIITPSQKNRSTDTPMPPSTKDVLLR